jgi:hypothetical protein
MTISLLQQSHGNQADGCSFTWDYSAASASGVTPSSGHLLDIKMARMFSIAAARLSVAINVPSAHSVETR